MSGSRNRREGNYTGIHRGRHLRTTEPRYYCGAPYASLAWALASARAGVPLLHKRLMRAVP